MSIKIVYIIIESIFFLFSFSALPVSAIYYMKSGESWIPPYVGIQITAGMYAVLDVMYNGAIYNLAPLVPADIFVIVQTLLRALLLVLIPVFMNRLFDLSRKKVRCTVFFSAGGALALWTAVVWAGPGNLSHRSAFYLAGSLMSVLLAGYVLVTAVIIHSQLKPPIRSTNRLFILAGPVYIAYLAAYTLFPLCTGEVFRTGPLSFTNAAYGIWNIIFLWFLVRFMTESHSASGRDGNLHEFLESYTFTEREGEIIALVVQGMGNKQIAAELGIHENTVKARLYNAYTKIGVHTRVELMKAVYGA